MNRYDEKYNIRLGKYEDIEKIMSFIEQNWKVGHILAVNRRFFEYEFLENDGTVNFVLAIDKEKNTIECINGFLKASHDQEHLDIWGSLWKVLDNNMGMLGAEIIRRRAILTKCRCDIDVGDNPKTAIPVLKTVLKRYTAKMNHYYMLSTNKPDFKIAKIYHNIPAHVTDKNYKIVRLCNIDQVKSIFNAGKYINHTPYKDYWYLSHRFFEHPIYSRINASI